MSKRSALSTILALALLTTSCVGDTGDASTTLGLEPRTSTTTTTDGPGGTSPASEGEFETVPCDDAPDDIVIVCEAYELIEDNYVDDLSDETLIQAAVDGLRALEGIDPGGKFTCPLPTEAFVAVCEAAVGRDLGELSLAETIVNSFALFGLDPNSLYLDEEALALLQEEQQGEIEGIGALVSPEDETIEGENKQCAIVSETCNVVIASTIEGTPAEAAGLVAGDIIVGVNGEEVLGWTIEELTARVRGPSGTDVVLTIRRASETFEVTITRAAVVIPVLETARFDDDGYIRLRVFNGTADEQFQTAVIEMVAQGIDDLVVDLRNNPGGLLDTAIEITSVFLPTGDVVVTQGPNDDNTYQVTGASLVPEDVDVIFVVNGGSASASEVVSAVLQERDRALVVGENTFGKNTVQQRFGLSNGGALKLTIARWLTPGGLDFGGVGVTPDVELDFASEVTPEDLVAAVVNLG